MKKLFFKGLRDGIPIALGYLSVSFGFGILCINLGLSVAAAVGISLTNLTSAGQVAGVGIIAAGGTLLEMVLTQLVINIRYSLFAISLSQKLDVNFTTPHRIAAAFGITDEIFAVSYAQCDEPDEEKSLKPTYMYGVILISATGWVSGTFLGATLGQILPESVSAAMGIMLYSMFLAICVPPARKDRGILVAVIAAAMCSILFNTVLTFVSGGFAVIISAVLSAALCAVLFPIAEEEEAA
ncbi:MAG: AzlC family ABC transporter permease [Clostridia bacterium]|nr:AzlC family ABC transporter permease [Clostridia bacterium]